MTVLVTQPTRLQKEKMCSFVEMIRSEESEDEWTDYKGKALVFRFT